MHGDKDTLIDQVGGRRTAELVPGAQLRIFEGMGHDMPPSYWERIAAGVIDNVASIAG